jgi:hypothetical protein
MAPELSIEPASGAIRFGGLPASISSGQRKEEVQLGLGPFFRKYWDVRNGYPGHRRRQ